ncbi:4-hydroxythreonine-4-phosphate dehydrogenase PdxA, partial [Mycetocola reblochoni]
MPQSTTADPATAVARPRVAVTLGDPAGVGPELAVRLLAVDSNRAAADIIVVATRAELDRAQAEAGVTVPVSDDGAPGTVRLVDGLDEPGDDVPLREVSEAAGRVTLSRLERALDLARAGEVEAIVFAPLNKTSLHLAGMHEEDELRWFARELGHDGVTSELNILGQLWTARVTSHIPHGEVAPHITTDAVTRSLGLLHEVLRDTGISQPRIGVAALNPHNGENGLFGRQEIDEIAPAVEAAAARGWNVRGPFPADTIFLRRDEFDGILTMYHDQGQIAMKLLGFDGGVT